MYKISWEEVWRGVKIEEEGSNGEAPAQIPPAREGFML